MTQVFNTRCLQLNQGITINFKSVLSKVTSFYKQFEFLKLEKLTHDVQITQLTSSESQLCS